MPAPHRWRELASSSGTLNGDQRGGNQLRGQSRCVRGDLLARRIVPRFQRVDDIAERRPLFQHIPDERAALVQRVVRPSGEIEQHRLTVLRRPRHAWRCDESVRQRNGWLRPAATPQKTGDHLNVENPGITSLTQSVANSHRLLACGGIDMPTESQPQDVKIFAPHTRRGRYVRAKTVVAYTDRRSSFVAMSAENSSGPTVRDNSIGVSPVRALHSSASFLGDEYPSRGAMILRRSPPRRTRK